MRARVREYSSGRVLGGQFEQDVSFASLSSDAFKVHVRECESKVNVK
jgi:hypothetical protein